MATELGKELRKMRIERDQNINDMAKNLNISISYLSSIENGKKKIPDGMIERVIKEYKLTDEKIETLRLAAINSSKEFEIDLSETSNDQRRLVYILSRKLKKMSNKKCEEIINKIK